MSDEVQVVRHGAIQLITINRPDAKNALNQAVAHLEERLRVRGADVLDRFGREVRQAHRRPACGGGTRHRDLSLGVYRLDTGRR